LFVAFSIFQYVNRQTPSVPLRTERINDETYSITSRQTPRKPTDLPSLNPEKKKEKKIEVSMSKRTTFTTISPLPAGIPREVVIEFLHNHQEMIDLNPLIVERHPIPPPAHAPDEEKTRCVWWSMTDKISYLPGGLVSGEIEYTAAFNDLPDGVQTHCYAPMSTDIRERWSLGGTLPGEPLEPVEIGLGAPRQGLYLREVSSRRFFSFFFLPFFPILTLLLAN
jgi:hypothetical protein